MASSSRTSASGLYAAACSCSCTAPSSPACHLGLVAVLRNLGALRCLTANQSALHSACAAMGARLAVAATN
eukprot:10706125-Heterocapsa_arctica.AAC.1